MRAGGNCLELRVYYFGSLRQEEEVAYAERLDLVVMEQFDAGRALEMLLQFFAGKAAEVNVLV